ncbi:MAG: glucosaminidase domain-containing protein [Bacteroidales bacterium]|jgi:uncharacterized FlgJ-related protein|nr:glucosaminidase domain-containing protein [Bacteroidales bacterium]
MEILSLLSPIFEEIIEQMRSDIYRRGLILIFLVVALVELPAQGKITREQYIEMYAGISMEEMVRSGIPASITLAQACLESNNGNSRLAVDGMNHFGIKCHEWVGKKIYHDDD